jgi:photosystem II stability/assembly factor-like uncharacterized protein
MKKSLFFFLCFCIMLSQLNAQLWTSQNTNLPGTSTGVDEISIADANTVWVKGFNGSGAGAQLRVFAKTSNGGTLWTAGTIGTTGTIMPSNFATSNGTRAFVVALDTVANTSSFWGTADGGTTWSLVCGILNYYNSFADGVEFWNATQGFCYGDPIGSPAAFEIYTTTNGGQTWTTATTSVAPVPASEYGYNGAECSCIVKGTGIGFIMTDHGRVLKTIDYGANWTTTATAPFTSSVYNSVKIYASSVNYIICATYLTSTATWTWKYTSDGGTTWNAYAPSGNFYQYGMCYVPGTPNRFVASSPYTTLKGIAYSDNGGQSWTDFTDALLQVSGANIQCLAVGFNDITTGWVGNYGSTGNTILKYYDPLAAVNSYNYISKNDVNIFPNPSSGNFTISLNGPNQEAFDICISDVTGKTLMQKTMNTTVTPQQIFDLSQSPKGIYLINIKTNSEIITKKIVIR